MYSNLQYATQVVRIENVNTEKNEIHCVSKDGGRFVLQIPISNGVYRIPSPGESWIVRREDMSNWFFEGIVPDNSPYGSAVASPGDVIIESPSNFKISADNIYFNNLPLGVWEQEEFAVGESTVELTLEDAPVSSAIQVFNNGLLISPSGIIIREQSLLFNEPLSVGIVVVYYMRSPER